MGLWNTSPLHTSPPHFPPATYSKQFLLPNASCTGINKMTRPTKSQKAQFEETEQASEPDSHMAGMLKLSDYEFKTTVIRTRALMDKVDSMQEQMDNVSRKMETLKNQNKILEIKNTSRNKDFL